MRLSLGMGYSILRHGKIILIKVILVDIEMVIRSIIGHNSVVVDMILTKNILSIFILFGVLASTAACGQTTDHNISSDQKKVLHLYASKYLLKDYQHLYYKSENSYYKSEYLLKVFLEPPLTPKDFKLPKLSTLPGNSQQYLDTLFSDQELQAWSKQIEEYAPIRWHQKVFPDSV